MPVPARITIARRSGVFAGSSTTTTPARVAVPITLDRARIARRLLYRLRPGGRGVQCHDEQRRGALSRHGCLAVVNEIDAV